MLYRVIFYVNQNNQLIAKGALAHTLFIEHNLSMIITVLEWLSLPGYPRLISEEGTLYPSNVLMWVFPLSLADFFAEKFEGNLNIDVTLLVGWQKSRSTYSDTVIQLKGDL